MKIEIHIRDTKSNGKRVGGRACYVESCRVFKEAGDGLRLDNLAVTASRWFLIAAKMLANGKLPSVEKQEELFNMK